MFLEVKNNRLNKSKENYEMVFIMVPSYSLKLLLLGEGEVGKTSLIKRYVDNFFQDNYKMTIGVDFLTESFDFTDEDGSKNNVTMQLWDIAGQSRFASIAHVYMSNANGIVLVFDLSRLEQTYDKLHHWKEIARKHSPDVPIIVLGNKNDLAKKTKLSADSVKSDMDAAAFYRTSAKTGDHVKEAFESLAKSIVRKGRINTKNDIYISAKSIKKD